MAVSQSTIFSKTFETIYDLLNANLTDPKSRSRWIYSSFPDKDLTNKDDYPVVIVDKAGISASPITFKDLNFVDVTIPVDVFSTSSSELDSISDAIYDEMEDNIATLHSNGLKHKTIMSSIEDTLIKEGLKIHMKTINFQFTIYHA